MISPDLVQKKETTGAMERKKQEDGDPIVRNRLHEAGMRAWCPLVGPVLATQHCAARMASVREHQNGQVHHWHPALFADWNRFTPSSFDRRENVWRCRTERYAGCDITQHDSFGGGSVSVMVWGGMMLEGCTDLPVIANSALTTGRYWDEIYTQCGLIVTHQYLSTT